MNNFETTLNEVKKEIKEEAQDQLMQAMANGILVADERHEDKAMITEMKKQAARIGKKFGYVDWPGIF